MREQTIKNLLVVLAAGVLAMVTLKAVEIGMMQKEIEYNRKLIQKAHRRIALLQAVDKAPCDVEGFILLKDEE